MFTNEANSPAIFQLVDLPTLLAISVLLLMRPWISWFSAAAAALLVVAAAAVVDLVITINPVFLRLTHSLTLKNLASSHFASHS